MSESEPSTDLNNGDENQRTRSFNSFNQIKREPSHRFDFFKMIFLKKN